MRARRLKPLGSPRTASIVTSPRILWKRWIGDRRPTIIFSAKFLALLAGFNAVTHVPFCQLALPAYLNTTAFLGNRLAHLLGESSQVTDSTIWSTQFAITISPDCS